VIDTDAEGRFVVGDGCSYLARELGVRTLIDSTTLTDTNAFTAYKHGAVLAQRSR
jgi:leucyl aminopeptidase